MIVSLLNSIKNVELKAFLFRVYNTFKSVILPIILSMVLIQLQNHPGDVSCLLEKDFWFNMLYAVIVALVGGAIAGLDKLSRMTQR